MITNLQKRIFEKFIDQKLFEKICLYVLVNKTTREAIIDILKQFIKTQIILYKKIKQFQFESIGTTITPSKLEEILQSESKYHIINYTYELINALELNPSIFSNIESISTLESIYEQHLEITSFIESVFNTYKEIIISDNKQEILDQFLREIFEIIELFEEVNNINDIAGDYELLLEKISSDKVTSIYSVLNHFKSIIQNSYIKIVESDISKLQDKDDIFKKQSLITFGASDLSKTITDYIVNYYEVFPTGLKFIDERIGGIESESVFTICAPSNHGKSLFLLQLAESIIETNINSFNQNDVILHITLEDNKIKLSKRIFTIFGNYLPSLIKQLYYVIRRKSQQIESKNNPELIKSFSEYINDIFQYLERDSINTITQNKVFYMIQDQAESQYTSSNLLNTLTTLKLKGYNVRLVFLDYVDLMTSTRKYEKEYDEHGQIIKDLRVIAKDHHIPIITATQLKRETENPKVPLANTAIGDSYKKVRYSDYIIMLRQLYNYTHSDIYNHLSTKINPADPIHTEILEQILLTEYSLTKMKDAEKLVVKNNDDKFLLFSKFNLRLYDTFEKLYDDYLLTKEKNQKLIEIINSIENFTGSSNANCIF